MYNYKKTPLEDYIHSLYDELQIKNPNELSIIDITAKLNIWVYFADTESKAIERNGLHSMIIDRRLSQQEQWQDFGHELCHLLRHAGNQICTHSNFIQYQETQAEQFALHFCVPTFMLQNIEFPADNVEAVSLISETFNVTHEFSAVRLEKHIRRLYQARMDHQIQKYFKPKSKPRGPSEWSDETKKVMDKLYKQLENKKAVSS